MYKVTKPLSCERRGKVAWITLNRPDAFNAFTPEMLDLLDSYLDELADDRDLSALVITHTGKAFCTGADLNSVLDGAPGKSQEEALIGFLQRAKEVFCKLEDFPRPTVAIANGFAMAGGLEMLLCCDFALAGPKALFGEGHAKYCQMPGGGASLRLSERIGKMQAKLLSYTGDLITPQRALEIGLISSAFGDDLEAETDRILAAISEKSTLGLTRMKKLIDTSMQQSRDLALDAEINMSALHVRSNDRNEGLAAFVEKRQPDYQGR